MNYKLLLASLVFVTSTSSFARFIECTPCGPGEAILYDVIYTQCKHESGHISHFEAISEWFDTTEQAFAACESFVQNSKKMKNSGAEISSDCVEGSNFAYGSVILISWVDPMFDFSNVRPWANGDVQYKNWAYSTPEEKKKAVKECKQYKRDWL